VDHHIFQAAREIFEFHSLALILVGTVCGVIAGAIPGFTVTMGVVLAFPFTFAMDATSGLALMIAILVGGYAGGLISGIMLGIPGTPSSVATVFDGHPMAKNGEPGRALGLGIISSFLGTIMSVAVLVAIAPLVARFSLKFGPWEITALVIFAITLVGSLASGAILKGCITGAFGLLVATTGIGPSGQVRFNFGFEVFSGGVEMLPVLIGAFAFGQLINAVEETAPNDKAQGASKDGVSRDKLAIPTWQILRDLMSEKVNLLRSVLIGCVIGAIPAVGGSAANFVSYDQAKKFSRKPETFGTGVPAGIVAAEASNSALIGGALIPTLTLGIPGSLTMAIMYGVFILHGLNPGPRLFIDQPVLIGSIYLSILVAGFFMLFAMLLLIRVFTKIALVPISVLLPLVLMLATVGAYALNNSLVDVWTLLVFGLVGYLFGKAEAPLAPMILGVVLGPSLETNLFRALQLDPNIMTFLTRPISLVLLILTAASVIFAAWQELRASRSAVSGAGGTA
jgi:putative tricarboxylic transport membrane protein